MSTDCADRDGVVVGRRTCPDCVSSICSAATSRPEGRCQIGWPILSRSAVKMPAVFMRWWRRHRDHMFWPLVGPWGQGTRWSLSHWAAARVQVGNWQTPSRTSMPSCRSAGANRPSLVTSMTRPAGSVTTRWKRVPACVASSRTKDAGSAQWPSALMPGSSDRPANDVAGMVSAMVALTASSPSAPASSRRENSSAMNWSLVRVSSDVLVRSASPSMVSIAAAWAVGRSAHSSETPSSRWSMWTRRSLTAARARSSWCSGSSRAVRRFSHARSSAAVWVVA